jgi:hypothetical protein
MSRSLMWGMLITTSPGWLLPGGLLAMVEWMTFLCTHSR